MRIHRAPNGPWLTMMLRILAINLCVSVPLFSQNPQKETMLISDEEWFEFVDLAHPRDIVASLELPNDSVSRPSATNSVPKTRSAARQEHAAPSDRIKTAAVNNAPNSVETTRYLAGARWLDMLDVYSPAPDATPRAVCEAKNLIQTQYFHLFTAMQEAERARFPTATRAAPPVMPATPRQYISEMEAKIASDATHDFQPSTIEIP